MNSEKEHEDFETHFRSLPPYNESHEFMLERKKDGTYKFSNVQEYFIKWQARAALSTEAQPEVKGAVAYRVSIVHSEGPRALCDNPELLAEARELGCKIEPLYPPSAIEAAVREKLEEAAQIVIASRWVTVEQALEIAETIRALMEPKS